MCDCGNRIVVQSGNLRSKHTQSCGCSHIKYGHHKKGQQSKTYRSWDHMIQRCTNLKNKNYHHYGGRGITVCQRWMKFENFLKDMGELPIGKSIDRINNNKGYFKENCRWVTQKQQMRNTRRNCLKTFNGETQCVFAWSEETGIPENTLRARFRYGWSIERALTEPIKRGELNA